MTMSCEADAKATQSASMPSRRIDSEGGARVIAAIPASSANWVSSIQPRRRPRKGGTNRSMIGDQRNFSR